MPSLLTMDASIAPNCLIPPSRSSSSTRSSNAPLPLRNIFNKGRTSSDMWGGRRAGCRAVAVDLSSKRSTLTIASAGMVNVTPLVSAMQVIESGSIEVTEAFTECGPCLPRSNSRTRSPPTITGIDGSKVGRSNGSSHSRRLMKRPSVTRRLRIVALAARKLALCCSSLGSATRFTHRRPDPPSTYSLGLAALRCGVPRGRRDAVWCVTRCATALRPPLAAPMPPGGAR